jgi:small subunit ribosomal protein S19e
MSKPTTVRDVPVTLFISKYAEYLKRSGQIRNPSWLEIVKTGIHKKNSPLDSDWFFFRLASLARRFYIRGGNGVGNLRKKYGGKKRRGSRPVKKLPSGGKIIRFALQELERLNILFKNEKGKRLITKKAQQDMDIRSKKIVTNS